MSNLKTCFKCKVINKVSIILTLAMSVALIVFVSAHSIHNAGRVSGMADLVEGRVIAKKLVAKTGVYWRFERIE